MCGCVCVSTSDNGTKMQICRPRLLEDSVVYPCVPFFFFFVSLLLTRGLLRLEDGTAYFWLSVIVLFFVCLRARVSVCVSLCSCVCVRQWNNNENM